MASVFLFFVFKKVICIKKNAANLKRKACKWQMHAFIKIPQFPVKCSPKKLVTIHLLSQINSYWVHKLKLCLFCRSIFNSKKLLFLGHASHNNFMSTLEKQNTLKLNVNPPKKFARSKDWTTRIYWKCIWFRTSHEKTTECLL